MKNTLASLVAIAVLLMAASTASAMWCNGHVILVGDTKPEVLTKCGEPFYANVIATAARSYRGAKAYVTVEQLAYNQGPRTFLKVLTFKGGELIRIEDGDKP